MSDTKQPLADASRFLVNDYASLIVARDDRTLTMSIDEGDQGTDEPEREASITLGWRLALALKDWLNNAFPEPEKTDG